MRYHPAQVNIGRFSRADALGELDGVFRDAASHDRRGS